MLDSTSLQRSCLYPLNIKSKPKLQCYLCPQVIALLKKNLMESHLLQNEMHTEVTCGTGELFPAAQKKKTNQLRLWNFNKQDSSIFSLAAVGGGQRACFAIPKARGFVAMVSQCLPRRSSPKQNKAVPCLSSLFKLCCNQDRDEYVTRVRDSNMETCSVT